MRFANPTIIACPACSSKSDHAPRELLELRAHCPSCGASLSDAGMRMRKGLEDSMAFGMWAEVLFITEERLGIVTCDAELMGQREGFTSLTLQDMVGLVESQLPAEAVASGKGVTAVLESASDVTGHAVELEVMRHPILQSLSSRVPCPLL